MSLQPTNSTPIILQGLQTFLKTGRAFGMQALREVGWVRRRGSGPLQSTQPPRKPAISTLPKICTANGCNGPLDGRHVKSLAWRELPGGPVVRTPSFHSKRHGFDPWLGKTGCGVAVGKTKIWHGKKITYTTNQNEKNTCNI